MKRGRCWQRIHLGLRAIRQHGGQRKERVIGDAALAHDVDRQRCGRSVTFGEIAVRAQLQPELVVERLAQRRGIPARIVVATLQEKSFGPCLSGEAVITSALRAKHGGFAYAATRHELAQAMGEHRRFIGRRRSDWRARRAQQDPPQERLHGRRVRRRGQLRQARHDRRARTASIDVHREPAAGGIQDSGTGRIDFFEAADRHLRTKGLADLVRQHLFRH